MKILLLYYSPWWNATAYYGVTLAKGLQQKGNKVWFGTNKNSPGGTKAKESDIDVFDVKLETINPVKFVLETLRIVRLIKHENIDIINTLSPQGHLLYFFASRIFGLKTPLIRTCCDARAPKGSFFNKWLYSRCVNWLIFPCKSNFERYYEILRFAPQRTSVIYAGIDIEKFENNKPEAGLRKKYSIGRDVPIVGNLGRLSPEKGHRNFLHIAAQVLAKEKNVKFVIAGKEEQVSVESLREIASNLSIKDKVIFTGFVDDPRTIIGDFSIGVITSRFSETISRAALEYKAYSKPVIATEVNVLPEIIGQGKSGLVYGVDDIKGMAEGIVDLLRNEDKCRKWGKKGRWEIENKYSIEIIAKETLKVYSDVVDNK